MKKDISDKWLAPGCCAVWNRPASRVLHLQLCCEFSLSPQPALEMHTWIIPRCHFDGQVSRISAKASFWSEPLWWISGGLPSWQICYFASLSFGSFSNLIAQTVADLPRGFRTIPLPAIFWRKARILGRVHLTFQRWIRKLLCPLVFLRKIRSVTLLWAGFVARMTRIDYFLGNIFQFLYIFLKIKHCANVFPFICVAAGSFSSICSHVERWQVSSSTPSKETMATICSS